MRGAINDMCKPRFYKIKIISITTVVTIMILVIIGVINYNEYLTTQTNYTESIASVNEQMKRYMFSIIEENQDKAKTLLENKTSNIQEKILQEYGLDRSQLEKDILYPNNDSKLSKIFDQQLSDSWINNNSPDNRAFVGSTNSIIWNRTIDNYSFYDKEILDWYDVIYSTYNEKFANESIESILKGNKQKYDFIIWQNRSSNISLDDMSMSKLLDELAKNNYDLNELKGYELLVPVYITEDGDIFGVKDVNSLGLYNNNFKIIIVQRLNLYDIMQSHKANIEYYQNELNIINHNILENRREKVSMIIYIFIFIISITVISGMVQNSIKE